MQRIAKPREHRAKSLFGMALSRIRRGDHPRRDFILRSASAPHFRALVMRHLINRIDHPELWHGEPLTVAYVVSFLHRMFRDGLHLRAV